MATWFAVGGPFTWDDVTTTHWSLTSGGAGSAGVPTTGDTVKFDGNSGLGTNGTVTYNGTKTFAAIVWGDTAFAGTTVTLSLSASLNCTGVFTHSYGVLLTNNFNCTWGSYAGSNNNNRTLTPGSSTFTCSLGGATAWNTGNATNLTITANTATILLTGNGASFNSGANHNGTSVTFNTGGGSWAMFGSHTIKDFTVTGSASKGDQIAISGTTTVTGTTLFTGNNAAPNRLWIRSANEGVQNSLICNGAHGAHAYVDFRDIAVSGSAGSLTGTLLGDTGGNSGITFPASIQQGWVGTAGGLYSDVTKWPTRVPLPHDDVQITTAFAAGQTITIDNIRACRNLSFAGTTGNPTVTIGGGGFTIRFYGSINFANVTVGGSGNSTMLSGRSGNFTLTPDASGKISVASLFCDAVGSTYKALANLIFTGQINISDGFLDGNGFNITSTIINLNSGNTRGLIFGSGTWSLTSTGTVFDGTGATITPGTGVIDITDTSNTAKTFVGGGKSYPTLRHSATGTAGLTITGNNTFNGTFIKGTRTVTLPANGTQTVLYRFTTSGAVNFVSSTPGTATTIHGASGCIPSLSPTSTRSADVVFTFDDVGVLRSTLLRALEPAYTVKALEPTYKVKPLEPAYTVKSLEPTYSVKGLELEY